MLIYTGYALAACMLAFGLGAFAALGWQMVMCTPRAWTKLRTYKLQVVRK